MHFIAVVHNLQQWVHISLELYFGFVPFAGLPFGNLN